MKSQVFSFSALAIAVLLVSSPISAHHGSTHYDMKRTITLAGTITAFDWANPHCLVYLDVMDANSQIQHWTLEMAATYSMSRRGWNKDTVKRGDMVVAEVHPAVNGASVGISSGPGFALRFVVNGREMPTR